MPQLFVTQSGSGSQPILFLHGLWGGGNYFRELDLSPIAQGPKYFPDELGFGKSPKPNGSYTPKIHCDALIASLPTDQKFIVIGQSFGALLACYLATDYPERIDGLVLISPVFFESIEDAKTHLSTNFVNKLVIQAPFLAALLCFFSCRMKIGGLVYPNFVTPLQKPYMSHLTEHTWHSFYATFSECLLSQPTFDIAQKAVARFPTLVVAGNLDSYEPTQTIAKLHSEQLTKVIVPEIGHKLLFLRYRQTLKIVQNWLAQEQLGH